MDEDLNFQFKLILSIFLMGWHQFIIGCSYVFSSVILPQLREPNSTIKLNSEEASWIASIPILVCPFGLIIIGVLTDKFGRRKTLQLAYIPLIVSWFTLAYADSYNKILIGRFIMGISLGSGTCMYVYLAEVCPADQRHIFGSTITVFIGLGTIVEFLLAVFFTWNTVSLTLGIASVIGCLLLFCLPEPPLWLRNRGQIFEAEIAEKWFGRKYSVVIGPNKKIAIDTQQVLKPSSYWSEYAQPTVWKPTLITLTFFCCQQCSGFYVMLFYSVDVLQGCRVPLDGITVTVFLFGTRVISSVIYIAMYEFRRKTLAVVSCAGMAGSLSVIVAYMKWFDGRDVADGPAPFGLVLVIAFTMYMFFGQIGILPMPWALCGEVFPMAVKGTMNGIVQTIGYLIMFTIIKIYPMMVNSFGIQDVWFLFTIICLLSGLFCLFILPETKGIPLDVILSYFETKNKITNITNIS